MFLNHSKSLAVKCARLSSTVKQIAMPMPPVFTNVIDQRKYNKEILAGAFRLFSKYGFDEGVAGHITFRDPEFPETFWVNPFGVDFSQVCVSNLIRVDKEG
jgi:hypothetical protein